MFRVYVSLILSVISIADIYANNVRIPDNARFVGFLRGDSLQVRFPLAWDNSWRDAINWDAVYLFMKYRDPDRDGGAWHHAYLEENGHNVGSGLEYTPMKTGDLTAGIMVYRDGSTNQGVGDISVNVRLLWNLKNGTAPYIPSHDDLESGKIEFTVFAIEMVYVANGPYYLGDVISYNSILNEEATDKKLISGEMSTNISFEGKNSTVVTIPDDYPKGYNGFYCMKYEVSQEQYVTFLNFLTYAQQKQRIGNNLDKLEAGDFVFGDPKLPSCRNAIIVTEKNGSSRPVVFGNNLNVDNPYNRTDDGKTIACNYLTYEDMLAYCRWAGLRPMTEMEYEKACRGLFVEYDPNNDYAWGSRAITPLIEVKYPGMLEEEAGGAANVNAGKYHGPVRCGAFARRNNINRELAGATYWGVMEMTGNVKELCYNVLDGKTFVPEHGTGEVEGAVSGWETIPSVFIMRGGGYTTSDVKELATSFRKEDRLVLKAAERDSTVGFRAVHSVPPVDYSGEVIFLTNGEEEDVAIACDGTPYTITGNQTAYGLYIWERCDSTVAGFTPWEVIQGQNSFNLSVTDLLNNTYIDRYVFFRRRTVKPEGDSYSNQVKLRVPGMPVLSSEFVSVYGCGGDVDPLVAQASAKGNFSWWMLYDTGDELIQTTQGVSTDTLIIDLTALKLPPGATSRIYTLRCEFSTGGNCFVASVATVSLDGIVTCPTQITDSRDGNTYQVVQMPDCYCWFAEPLRLKTGGSLSADNNESNDARYGRLYSWDVDLTDETLCPEGWRVPDMFDLLGVATAVNTRGANKYSGKWVTDFTDHGWYYDKGQFGRGFYSAGSLQDTYIQIYPDNFLTIDGMDIFTEFSPSVYLPVRCVMNEVYE